LQAREKTAAQLAGQYEIHPTMINRRWNGILGGTGFFKQQIGTLGLANRKALVEAEDAQFSEFSVQKCLCKSDIEH
jgi:hypothetical protein